MREHITLIESANENVEEGIEDWKKAAAGLAVGASLFGLPSNANHGEDLIPTDANTAPYSAPADDYMGASMDSTDGQIEPASAPEFLNDEEELKESYAEFVQSQDYFGEAVLASEKKTLK